MKRTKSNQIAVLTAIIFQLINHTKVDHKVLINYLNHVRASAPPVVLKAVMSNILRGSDK